MTSDQANLMLAALFGMLAQRAENSWSSALYSFASAAFAGLAIGGLFQ